MFKQISLYTALVSTLILSGCTSLPGLNLDLPEPRPVIKDSSHAMKVASAIQTTAHCFGCLDTPLWQDEKDLENTASFYAKRVAIAEYKAASEYREKLSELRKQGKLNKETLPPPPKVVLNEMAYQKEKAYAKSNGLTNGLMLANSFDGRWSNPGASLGAGLALGLLFSSAPPDEDENRMFPPADFMKAAIVVPEKIPFDKFSKGNFSQEENEKQNASAYGATEFVRLMTKSAVDMGYKPVGDVRYRIWNDRWELVYQPLENDAIGCPKVTPETDRIDMCRIEFGNYTHYAVRHVFTYHYEKTVVPDILGGDGKKVRWIAHMGYHQDQKFALIVDEAEKLIDEEGDRNYRLAMGMQKHIKPGQFIYVPSYHLSNGEWSPQCVLDSKGTHYFAVVVPENRPAPVAPTPSATESAKSEKNAGLNGWLNKLTNF